MKDKILELYNQNPKQWTKLVNKDIELMNWINEQIDTFFIDYELKFKVAIIFHGDPRCCNGNIKKYYSFLGGWKFCDKLGKCKCASDNVSKLVILRKQEISNEQQLLINIKRAQTNIEKYGVSNAGQTITAKQKHLDFYANQEKSKQAVLTQQNTLNEKYGVNNARHITGVNEKIKATLIEKFGFDNPMKNKEIKDRGVSTRKELFDPIELYKKNYVKFCQMVNDNWEVKALLTEKEYHGVVTCPLMKFECIHCYYIFEKKFTYASPPICKNCNPTEFKYVSNEEQQIFDYIKTIYNGQMIQGDKSIINPFQLDIYLPELKLAIEYNGLYWHSELSSGKSWNYHAKKYKLCRDKNIRLITIFSDEWNLKKDQVKQTLLNIIGKNTKKLFARKCVIKEVSKVEATNFHNKYHLQESPKFLGINIGLFFKDNLVSLMSFKNKSNNEYELIRASSSIRVVGGASKIFSYFISKINPLHVISFADLRWSQGNVYKQLGFDIVSKVPPMQSYVENYNKRYHKLQFTKSKIVESGSNLTEWQRMQELGFDRIWDCGKLKFKWSQKSS